MSIYLVPEHKSWSDIRRVLVLMTLLPVVSESEEESEEGSEAAVDAPPKPQRRKKRVGGEGWKRGVDHAIASGRGFHWSTLAVLVTIILQPPSMPHKACLR
jgi:hypothetical protein